MSARRTGRVNGNLGTQTVEEGAGVVVQMADIDRSGPSGGFFDRAGAVAW